MISLKIALSGLVALVACMICAVIAGDDDAPRYVVIMIQIGVVLSLLALFGGAIAVIWTMTL